MYCYQKQRENFKQIAARLNELADSGDDRFTVVYMGDFGGVCVMQGKIISANLTSYAQYSDALKITMKRKGARNACRFYVYGGNEYAFFAGWRSPAEQRPREFWGFDKTLFYKIADSVDGGEAAKIGENSERAYMDEIEQRGKVYHVHGIGWSKVFRTADELCKAYEKTGEKSGGYLRKELQGAPVLKGFIGAMYDGEDEDGNAVLRYETAELNERLSV